MSQTWRMFKSHDGRSRARAFSLATPASSKYKFFNTPPWGSFKPPIRSLLNEKSHAVPRDRAASVLDGLAALELLGSRADRRRIYRGQVLCLMLSAFQGFLDDRLEIRPLAV